MLQFDQYKRPTIDYVLDILRVAEKCSSTLGKIVPIGRSALGNLCNIEQEYRSNK